jgi:hypothetical protein
MEATTHSRRGGAFGSYAHALAFLHDSSGIGLTERLMQLIWHHQRLRRDHLQTGDGLPVRILHPGFWNFGAGPDFRGAVMQFGDERPVEGDVEIDLESAGWRQHGHNRNRDFSRVILHVIWEKGSRVSSLPTLALSEFLDAPLEELSSGLRGETALEWPEMLIGQCAGPLRFWEPERLSGFLEEAGWTRFLRKAKALEARAAHAGEDRALWEGLLRGLGYSRNVWPLQRIAELAAPLRNHGESMGVVAWQARLFGLSGLLPGESLNGRNSDYIRKLWGFWWRERGEFYEDILPAAAWNFRMTRPSNHPHRRLALAAHWLSDSEFISRISNWTKSAEKPRAAAEQLRELLNPRSDRFWERRFTLHSMPGARPFPLLGRVRTTDLAANVILPWAWNRATRSEDESNAGRLREQFFRWPASQDNAVLALARRRLWGNTPPQIRWTLARQQGLLQVVADFCSASNAICASCKFPEFVSRNVGNHS